MESLLTGVLLQLAARTQLFEGAEVLIEWKPYVVWGSLAIVLVMGLVAGPGHARRMRRNRARNNRPSRSQSNELGSGDLATKEHIKRWITPHDKFDTQLEVEGLRGGDGIALKRGHLIIPREERNRHMLIIAKTGSGKTTKLILPVLYSDCLNPHRSTIVLDSKPEMWDKLAGLTKKHNPEKKILLFNPLDRLRSLSWNILGKVETDTDAKLIANTVIMATDNPNSKSDSPFFRNNALQLLNAMMCGLLADPNDTLSMPRVHELIHSGMKNLCDWLEAHPQAIRNSRTFVELARSGSQNADTIMSELSMRMAAWDLTDIRALTAFTELDIEALIHEPTLFIIELRESELEMLRPMANVIVIELLRFLTKRAEACPKQTLPRPVSLVIDEFASALGRLPDIHVKLNTLRSRNVSIVGAIQSIAQIKANYDKDADSVLSGFSTKIFMPSVDFQDAEWASKETGTMTVRFNVMSKGKNKRMVDYFAHRNDNVQEQVQQRPVLTPDEIGRPIDNIATFFLPNTPVFQGHLVPFYKVPEMLKRIDEGKDIDVLMRETPLEYVEQEPLPVQRAGEGTSQGQAGIGNIFNLTPDQLREAIESNKQELGYETLDAIAKDWWKSFEEANAENLAAVLNLTQELIKREVSIAEFYNIYATTGLQDVTKILAAIDQHVYNELKLEIGWESVSQHAKEWWHAFEEANKANFPVVVELARELKKRSVTIDDFFSAYVHSDYDTIPEILGLIDELISQGKIGSGAVAPAETAKTDSQAVVDEPTEANAIESLEEYDYQPSVEIEELLAEETEEKAANGSSHVVEHVNGIASASNGVAQRAKGPLTKQIEKSKENRAPVQARAKKNEAAKRSVHVNSFFAMADELLKNRRYRDFDVLLQMAKEDGSLNGQDLTELSAMKSHYLAEASEQSQ